MKGSAGINLSKCRSTISFFHSESYLPTQLPPTYLGMHLHCDPQSARCSMSVDHNASSTTTRLLSYFPCNPKAQQHAKKTAHPETEISIVFIYIIIMGPPSHFLSINQSSLGHILTVVYCAAQYFSIHQTPHHLFVIHQSLCIISLLGCPLQYFQFTARLAHSVEGAGFALLE